MDLSKTGKFIQEQRKFKKLTQVQLAQKIGVSEKTISKWECGNGFPDTSLLLPLCKALDITANELLSAKSLPNNDDYKQTAENNLIALKSQQEKSNKYLLTLEWVIIWFSIIILLGCCIVASYVSMPTVWRILLIVFGMLNIVVGIWASLIIEKDAGYYQCRKCKYKHIPSFKSILWSMHFGRTRYIKCPKCNKKSWQKKKLSDD